MAMTMKLGALRMHELKVYVKNKMRKMIPYDWNEMQGVNLANLL